MGPFRGPYRGSPLRDPCWWAVTTEVAAHWEEVLMGPFRGGTHNTYFNSAISLARGMSDDLCTNITKPLNQTTTGDLVLHWMYTKQS